MEKKSKKNRPIQYTEFQNGLFGAPIQYTELVY